MERERTGGGYTVHELAELSGCTVRTLHHYDELGLVRAQRANNGYRRYGAAEVDRLHQVLLYRDVYKRQLVHMKDLLRRSDAIGVRGVNLLEFCFPLHNAEADVYKRQSWFWPLSI